MSFKRGKSPGNIRGILGMKEINGPRVKKVAGLSKDTSDSLIALSMVDETIPQSISYPFHTCPSCGEDGAEMLILDARRGWQKDYKFLCEHEDCTKKEHEAVYEIACKCGDEFFLCERHGEWEIVKAKKGWRRKKNKDTVFSMLARPSEGDNPAVVEDGNGVHEVRLKDLGVEK